MCACVVTVRYQILQNKIRTVEVWFDEYKDLFYKAVGAAAEKFRPKIPLPVSGKGAFVDPSVEETETFRNISQRLELREKLKCKPFSW